MKIELKNEIAKLIEEYGESAFTLNEEIKEILEYWKDIALKNNLNPQSFHTSVTQGIQEAHKRAKATAINRNQALNKDIQDAKKQILSNDVKSDTKPVDYAARVANALQFLSYQLDDLTDESAYLILKDFVDDLDQMRLFRNVIEKRVEMVDVAGNSLFPKTFGKLIKADVMLNMFNEIESIAEMLFTYPKQDGSEYIFGNVRYTLAQESFEELTGETDILTLAEEVDKLAEEFPTL